MELGEVLSRAWKIIWKNKILWIFGILASCGKGGGGGGSGGGNTNFNLPSDNGNLDNGTNPFENLQIPGMEEFGKNLEQLFGNGAEPPWGFIAGFICLVLFIILVTVFIGTIGRIGLIRGTVLAEEGQEPLRFGQVWSASTPYFWKVFLLNFLAGLVIGALMVAMILPLALLAVVSMGFGLICIIPLLCLLIPLSLVLNIILEQANVAMVVENMGVFDSIKRGWQVCRGNIGPIAVVAAVVIIGGGIVGFIIALPLILVMIPLIISAASEDQTALTSGMAIAGVLLCCLIPVVVALQGILTSFIGSVWTLTFLRLTAQKQEEPEIRILP